MIKLRNNTLDAKSWAGQLIEAGEYYTPEISEIAAWANNSLVLSDIGNASLVVNDGISDITDVSAAISLLKGEKPKDANGRDLVRMVAANAGWKIQFHSVRISTATANGYYNKNKAGDDLGFCTYAMYDANNQLTADTAACVKTVVTWEPTHDIEILGGRVFQKSAPSSDVWLYVTAAAHIPAQMGGSIAFAEGGVNMVDMPVGAGSNFDGRVAKYIAYDPVYHSGRFEILIKHDAGVRHDLSIIFELFKE